MRKRTFEKPREGSASAQLAVGLVVALALAMAVYIFFLIATGRLPEVVTRS